MRIAYFTGIGQIDIQDAPEPQITEPGEVKVRIDRVGVCGSDVHYYANGKIGDQLLTYPATLGHECSGTIVEVGETVRTLREGTRVAIDPAISCGQCDQCRAGRIHTCRNLRFLGSPGEAPGAVADFHVLPAENCVPVPSQISLDTAAVAEPLSVGLYAVRLAEMHSGARIAILGAGPIGLSVLLSAKATVASTQIIATDLLPERLAIAASCGANACCLAGEEPFPGKSGPREAEFDFVFECSGDPEILDVAQRLITPGGKIVLVGIPPTDRLSFDAHVFRRKEVVFQAVRRQRGCVEPAVDLLADDRIDASALITHHFPLENITEAFELAQGYKDGVIKAIVDLSGEGG